MGSMFGGGQQRTETRNEPWEAAQPYYKDIMQKAQDWYNTGGAKFWEGTANAPLTGQMQGVLGGLWNRGMGGSAVGDAAQNAATAIASGQTAGSNPAYNFLMGNVYGGNQNPAYGYAQGVMNNVQDNPALQYFNAEASGQNVGRNPWLDATYDKAANKIVDTFRQSTVPSLQSDYALSGRYGSNAMKTGLENARGGVMDQAQNLATSIYGGAYDADRNRQTQAMGGLSSAYAQDIQNKVGAGSFLSGIYDQNIQRQLYGAQQLGQLGQQDISNALNAAQLAPGLAGMDYTDLNAAMQAAQYGQQRAQGEQDLERQRWDYQQNQPFQNLQGYQSLISGLPLQGYGTTTQTQQQGGSTFGSLLGAGLGIGSMFMGMPTGTGSMFSTLFR